MTGQADNLSQKLPNCPRCGLDELWVIIDGVESVDVLAVGRAAATTTYTYRLRCYHCRLDCGKRTVAEGQTVDESIAELVTVIALFLAKLAALGMRIIR